MPKRSDVPFQICSNWTPKLTTTRRQIVVLHLRRPTTSMSALASDSPAAGSPLALALTKVDGCADAAAAATTAAALAALVKADGIQSLYEVRTRR